MTAKELLNLPRLMNESINMDFLYLQRLRRLLSQYGGSDALKECVQGGRLPDSPASRLVDNIVDLEHKINSKLLEYDALMDTVIQAIECCRDYKEISVLKKRYLEEKHIEVICEEMQLSQSRVFEILRSAQMKVGNFIKENHLEEIGNGTGQED